MLTAVLSSTDPEALARAVANLQAGEVVALPTETVYGLAADALNPLAVAKIFEAKERPSFDPLICHLPNLEWLARFVDTTSMSADSRRLVEMLAARFWPGPLTLVLPKRDLVPDLVTSGLPNVAVRLSAHPVLIEIAQRLDRPLAAPSANRFGRISPTTAEHVRVELEGRIPLIIDGGPTAHGIESTIVAVEGASLRILRSGPVTREQLAELAPIVERPASATPEAPGQLASHYSPRTRMCFAGDLVAMAPARIGLLAWRKEFWRTESIAGFEAVEVLSERGDLREAAATLFAKMRRLDEAGLDLILAEPVPESGLGAAIMDRLGKACAPR